MCPEGGSLTFHTSWPQCLYGSILYGSQVSRTGSQLLINDSAGTSGPAFTDPLSTCDSRIQEA